MTQLKLILDWLTRRKPSSGNGIPPLPPPRDGFWPRVASTPLRDLLAGRLSASLDLRRVVANSGLPEPLAGLVYETARRSAVREPRRIMAAREAIEHFQAGLAVGPPPVALAESYLTWERASGPVQGMPPVVITTLPPEVVGTIARVVRDAKLWPRERHDVSSELAAHFCDGLANGTSSDELTASFGDARSAARLIHRAKLRSRPLAFRALRRACQFSAAIAGAAVVGYCFLAARFFGNAPKIARNYIADVNAESRGLSPDERAWPLYRAALLKLPDDRPTTDDLMAGPKGEHWPEVLTFLNANRDTLDIARTATKKTHLGYVYGDPANREFLTRYAGSPDVHGPSPDRFEPEMMSLLLPHAQEMLTLAAMFEADARVAAVTGRGTRVTADVDALLGLAQHVREIFPCVVVELMVASVHTRATRIVFELLADQPTEFSENDLKQLAHALAGYSAAGHLRLRTDGERMLIDDLSQRIFSDDGNGDGHLTAVGLAALRQYGLPLPTEKIILFGPWMSATVAGRRETHDLATHWLDRFEAERRRPLWQWRPWSAEAEIDAVSARTARRLRFFPLALVMAGLDGAFLAAEAGAQEHDAVLTAIALELHRRRTGEWPPSLAELTPDVLPELPTDRFTGEPLRYRLMEGRPLLYSHGTDRDDDGGVRPTGGNGVARMWSESAQLDSTTVTTAWAAAHDGDWVLWPPVEDASVPFSN